MLCQMAGGTGRQQRVLNRGVVKRGSSFDAPLSTTLLMAPSVMISGPPTRADSAGTQAQIWVALARILAPCGQGGLRSMSVGAGARRAQVSSQTYLRCVRGLAQGDLSKGPTLETASGRPEL